MSNTSNLTSHASIDLIYGSSPPIPNPNVILGTNHDTNPTPQINLPVIKFTRHVHPPTYLQYYHYDLLSNTIHNSEEDAPNSSSRCKYHISSIISYDSLSYTNNHFILNLSTISEPHSYETTVCDASWRDAIETELVGQFKTNTLNLVPFLSHEKAIRYKCVLKLKLHANGII